MVSRNAAVPLYYQIYLRLRDEILTGQRQYGSAMPTELELSAQFGVSRITARRVLNELADERYVERKRRLGTRVIFQSPAKPIEANIDQAMDSLMALGTGTTVNVIEVIRKIPVPSVASALRLKDGEEVIKAARVRYLDGVPIGYVSSFVPVDLASIITPDRLARAPILRLLDEAGYKAVHADQIIDAMQADDNLSQALEIPALSAILRISRTSYDKNDRPFLLTFAHYRSDKFHIRLDLHGTKFAMGSSPEI